MGAKLEAATARWRTRYRRRDGQMAHQITEADEQNPFGRLTPAAAVAHTSTGRPALPPAPTPARPRRHRLAQDAPRHLPSAAPSLEEAGGRRCLWMFLRGGLRGGAGDGLAWGLAWGALVMGLRGGCRCGRAGTQIWGLGAGR